MRVLWNKSRICKFVGATKLNLFDHNIQHENAYIYKQPFAMY